MNKYKLLNDLMDSAFSIDLGLSEEEGEQIYVRMLQDANWRNRISSEMNTAFSDKNFSWMQFFDEHDIYSADGEDNARAYAEKILLAPLRSVEER